MKDKSRVRREASRQEQQEAPATDPARLPSSYVSEVRWNKRRSSEMVGEAKMVKSSEGNYGALRGCLCILSDVKQQHWYEVNFRVF